MNGNIIFKKGEEVIFSNVPGSENLTSSNSTNKKYLSKKVPKRKNIDLFERLSEIETNSVWKERFYKMSKSKFPPKISWVQGDIESDILGKIVYKFRQTSKEHEILKEYSDDYILLIIKSFIKKNTNIDAIIDNEIYNFSKDDIDPFPWSKLPVRDQNKKINDYVKIYSLNNNLTDYDAKKLYSFLILKSALGNITPYIEFNKSGDIEIIKNISYDKKNKYFYLSK